jgi:hypothetical protein
MIQSHHQAKINQWFQEQLEAIRLQGAGEGVWRDPIVQILAFEASLHKHHQEILADQDLFDAVFLELIRLASADDLREMAEILLERGSFDAVEGFNWPAQLKELGELLGLLNLMAAPLILGRAGSEKIGLE